MPKYPHIHVKLIGTDGNAFALMGKVCKALRAAKLPKEEVDAYLTEATAGDYNHLLSTTMNWVTVD